MYRNNPRTRIKLTHTAQGNRLTIQRKRGKPRHYHRVTLTRLKAFYDYMQEYYWVGIGGGEYVPPR